MGEKNEMKYVYKCKNKITELKDNQETIVKYNEYFMVICNDCCNVPVVHLLTRKEN
jgi:hypothetical protein